MSDEMQCYELIKEIREKLRLREIILENIKEGIIITDSANLKILQVNSAFAEITGYSAEELIGKTPKLLKSGWQGVEFYEKMWETIYQKGLWQGEIWDRRKDGELYAEWLVIQAIKDEKDRIINYLGIINEITEKKNSEETIRNLAYYDTLTKLPNRMLFKDRLNRAIEKVENVRKKLAILYIDLDKFKIVNETFGHHVGDQLLEHTSERLKSIMRTFDTIARISGDDFLVFLEEISSTKEVVLIAEKIVEGFKSPFSLMGYEVYIAPSIGITIYPEDGENASTLIKNADVAMYRAKYSGGNGYQFYTKEMNEMALDRIKMDVSLRTAIEKNQMFLVYQPQIDLITEKVVGLEALIRWQHPEQGLIPPSDFIPIAEENGLIISIGEWVLRTACQQFKEWEKEKYTCQSLAVNLSASQFRQEGLAQMIQTVIKETEFPPECLELELTESAVMRDVEKSICILEELKSIGIKISIDDFGTGYSSLNYLKRFPIDKLKIDRSFVIDINNGCDDAIIVQTIIAMAHNLRMKVIAEGVETEEQLDFLKKQHCDEVQGYYYSKPMLGKNVISYVQEKETKSEENS